MPLHLKINKDDVAETAIIAGDPERVKQLSTFLTASRKVNENRGFLMYTGTFDGAPMTIATHGIGGPSASIVIEELIMTGVKRIVRFGTAGSLRRDIKVGDVVLPTSASYGGGGTIGEYIVDLRISTSPDYWLLKNMEASFSKNGLKPFVGPVYSKDGFYSGEKLIPKLIDYGFLCVEMECATLFALSQVKNVQSACALLISDNMITKEEMLPAYDLKKYVDHAATSIFEALVKH